MLLKTQKDVEKVKAKVSNILVKRRSQTKFVEKAISAIRKAMDTYDDKKKK